MGLGKPEMDYFIAQVGLAAASFGVAKDDITAVAKSLNTAFNMACSPPATIIKDQGEQLQAICIDQSSCPKAEKAQCDKYAAVVKPSNATSMPSGSSMPTGTSMPTGSSMSSGTQMPSGTASSVPSSAAAAGGYSFAAAAAGLAAFLL